MNFDYKSRLGKTWDTTGLSRILKEMGCNSLSEAIAKERANLANHPKPIPLTQPEPSSNEFELDQEQGYLKIKPSDEIVDF